MNRLIVVLLVTACLLVTPSCGKATPDEAEQLPAIPFSEICTVDLDRVESIVLQYYASDFPEERMFLEEAEDLEPILAWLHDLKLGEPMVRRDDLVEDGATTYTFTLVSDDAEFSFQCVSPDWIFIGKRYYTCSEDDYQVARQLDRGNPQIPREVYHWRTDTWEPAE